MSIIYPKMDLEFKKKWIAALLSGDYEQTRGRLKAEYRSAFCCLGVACDLSGEGRWMNNEFIYKDRRDTVLLPLGLIEKWNIDKTAINVLVSMNDLGTSFKEIATWIEDNL